MPRGLASEVGNTRVSANGYHYTKTSTGWRLTHHLLAEAKVGRRLRADERAIFVDKNKTNLDPSNIMIAKKGSGSKRRIIGQLEARIAELEAQKEALEESLK